MDWYPWYPALYRADTLHLTAEQDGIYRRLIDHYMETRLPLPDNNMALARIAAVSPECFEHAASILRAFFQQCPDGLLRHKRCDIELDAQDERSGKRSDRARHAATIRWQNQHVKCSQHARSMLGDATRHNNTIHKETYTSDFEEFWRRFPEQRKTDKKKTFIEWKKLNEETHKEILNDLQAYIGSDEVANGFAKAPAGWLKGERWKVKYKQAGSSKSGKEVKRNVITI